MKRFTWEIKVVQEGIVETECPFCREGNLLVIHKTADGLKIRYLCEHMVEITDDSIFFVSDPQAGTFLLQHYVTAAQYALDVGDPNSMMLYLYDLRHAAQERGKYVEEAEELLRLGASLTDTDYELEDTIWKDMPDLPERKAAFLDALAKFRAKIQGKRI